MTLIGTYCGVGAGGVAAVAGPVDPSVQSIFPSAVFDVDATNVDSYDGTDTHWRNLVSSPADGAAQSAYDFMLGTTATSDTNDPTFNGTAGSQAAYWTFADTADCFQLPSNTTFMANLHQVASTQDWTFVFYYKTGVVGTSNTLLMQTRLAQKGISLYHPNNAGSKLSAFQSNGGGTASADSGVTYMPFSNDSFAAFTFDASTGELKLYVDSTTAVTTTLTFASGTNAAQIAAQLFTGMRSDYRAYAACAFNEVLSAANIATLNTFMSTRHGRTY